MEGRAVVVVALVDVGLAALSVALAFLLRGNLTLDDLSTIDLLRAMALAAIAAALAFALTGTSLALWRYVTIRDFGTLMAGATAAVLGFLALMFLWNRLETVPRAVPVIQWFVLVVALCGSRITYAGLIALIAATPSRWLTPSGSRCSWSAGARVLHWWRGCCRWRRKPGGARSASSTIA